MRGQGGYFAAIAERALLAPRSIVARRVQDDPGALPVLEPQTREHARIEASPNVPRAQLPPRTVPVPESVASADAAPSPNIAPSPNAPPSADIAPVANAAPDALHSTSVSRSGVAQRSFERSRSAAPMAIARDDPPQRAAEPAVTTWRAETERTGASRAIGPPSVTAVTDERTATRAAQKAVARRAAPPVSLAASPPPEVVVEHAHATDMPRETPAPRAASSPQAQAQAQVQAYALPLAEAARDLGTPQPRTAQPPRTEPAQRPGVHIGTVEVRVSPPPAAPARAAARTERAQPLARDLVGAFGLRES